MAKHAEDVTLSLGGSVVGIGQGFDLSLVGNEVEETGLGNQWKRFGIADLEWTMDVDDLWNPTDAAFIAIQTAFATKASLAVQWNDDDGNGHSGTALVTALGHRTAIGEAVTTTISLRGHGPIVNNPGGS